MDMLINKASGAGRHSDEPQDLKLIKLYCLFDETSFGSLLDLIESSIDKNETSVDVKRVTKNLIARVKEEPDAVRRQILFNSISSMLRICISIEKVNDVKINSRPENLDDIDYRFLIDPRPRSIGGDDVL